MVREKGIEVLQLFVVTFVVSRVYEIVLNADSLATQGKAFMDYNLERFSLELLQQASLVR